MTKSRSAERKEYIKVRFNREKVISSFKLDELMAAKEAGKKLCHWQPFYGNEEDLLKKWQRWFSLKNVPWAVTQCRNRWYLWKVNEEDPEIRNSRYSMGRKTSQTLGKVKKIEKTCMRCQRQYMGWPAEGDPEGRCKFGLCDSCQKVEPPDNPCPGRLDPLTTFLKENRPVRGM